MKLIIFVLNKSDWLYIRNNEQTTSIRSKKTFKGT